MTTHIVKLEVMYGSTRYVVNLYGTRVGKIYGMFKHKGQPVQIKLEASTEIHDAVKKKALAMITQFKEDRKKT